MTSNTAFVVVRDYGHVHGSLVVFHNVFKLEFNSYFHLLQHFYYLE
jgi:hypothetical protein